jgi:SAM-dependent methyltransferase
MPLTRSRYDGYAEWYDGWNQPHAERNAADVLDLLGPGEGLCLDLGCGCGHYIDALASTGRTVIGLDRSADQLRIARGRCRLDGIRSRRGGGRTSAGESECATTRWPNCSAASSPRS